MSWKQPIDTAIIENPDITALEEAIYTHIMLRARREDGVINFTHGGKHYTVALKRGQCIFKKQKFADELGVDVGRITRGIVNLSKMQTEMKTEAMPFGMIITVMNYDELTEMNTEMNTETKPNANRNQTETRAKKNVKNVENVKNVKEDALTDIEINEIAKNEDVAVQYVLRTLDLIKQYEQTHSKKYRNYKLTLKNWIKRDKQTNLNIPIYVPEPTPEERAKWAHIQEEYDRTHTN